MEGKTDPIEISLDCGVEREYEAVLLTGEKTAENTFEEPEKVSDKTVKMEGASKKFIYEAPAYSVSVLRLKKKQAFNPYLPSWEYIPDGEPYVFGDRVYVYGSHDFYNGHVFCLGDYVCWSAPVDNLADWRYEGVIYPKTEDPLNRDGKMCLYAPDVTVGPDGRYYLYYVLDLSLSYQLQFLTHRQENMNFMDMSMIKRETDSGKDRGMNHSLIREY